MLQVKIKKVGHRNDASTTSGDIWGTYKYSTSTFTSNALVYGSRLLRAVHEWGDDYVILKGVTVSDGEVCYKNVAKIVNGK